jgi:hypothetical protein
MTIYDALKRDHDKLRELANRLVACSEQGPDDWRSLVSRLRDELVPHSRGEEALFYNPIRATEPGKSAVPDRYQEHAIAEADLGALLAMKSIDAHWVAVAHKLRDGILRHTEEEESRVFAAAKLVFSPEEAENVGTAFNVLKPQLKSHPLAGTSVDFVLNLLPETLRTKLRASISEAKKTA